MAARARRGIPRLLPRLLRGRRRRCSGADARPPMAHRSGPHRSARRARRDRRLCARDVVTQMAGPLPLHLLPDTATIDDRGQLSIGGCDLLELAREYGTPLFVYDEAQLRARCREAVSAFPDGAAYATKAFLCLAMAKLAHEEGMQLDVGTIGEFF